MSKVGCHIKKINTQTSKFNHLNFHPPKVVSRYRDPQPNVDENYLYLFNSQLHTFVNLDVQMLI